MSAIQRHMRHGKAPLLVAILFFVFDIEVAFLYPWAGSFRENGMISFISMNIFLAILAVGLYYAVKKRVLEWK